MLKRKPRKVDMHFKMPSDVRMMLLALSKRYNRTYTEVVIGLILQEYQEAFNHPGMKGF